MRPIFLLIISLVITGSAWCDCADYGLRVWPESSVVLPANPLLVITGYGSSRDELKELDPRKSYFQSGKERIPLLIVQRLKGQEYLDQVLVKPSKLLQVGGRYDLHLFTKSGRPLLTRNNGSWLVSDADHQSPTWLTKPKFVGKRYMPLGCGPELYLDFQVCIADTSPRMYYVRLDEAETGERQAFCVLYQQGVNLLSIGHGMCAGEFDLLEGRSYRVKMWPVDLSGNKGPLFAFEQAFDAPSDGDIKPHDYRPKCNCPAMPKRKSNTPISVYWIVGSGMLLALAMLFMLRRRKKKSLSFPGKA